MTLPIRISARADFKRPEGVGFDIFRKADDFIKRELGAYGVTLQAAIARRAPRDTEQLVSSLEHEVRGDASGKYSVEVFSAVPYAAAALEDGRKAGKGPKPKRALLPWVVRHHFSPKELETVRRFAGRRAGAVYRNRQSPGKLEGHFGSIGAATTFYAGKASLRGVRSRSADVKQEFLVGRQIARRGIKAPKAITLAIADTKDHWESTKDRIGAFVADLLLKSAPPPPPPPPPPPAAAAAAPKPPVASSVPPPRAKLVTAPKKGGKKMKDIDAAREHMRRMKEIMGGGKK